MADVKSDEKTDNRRNDTNFIRETQQFGTSTSLHGVQYVTGEHIHFTRRILWLLVVLTAVTYSGYSIYEFFLTLQKHEISTKVSVEYEESMAFSAVTLCNLNQWRKSVLANAAQDMISRIYSIRQDDRNSFDWDAFYEDIYTPRGTLNLTEIALSPAAGAYSIDDMLFECIWNGAEECGSNNFSTRITDLGVCYTFNNPPNSEDALVVNKPGVDSGLTLTLDIMQYDYIAGEFQGAGVKVLLHPHGELPLMREAGFAVSPGFETLVSIKHIKTKSERHPYTSNCTNDSLKYSERYTVPLCLHECKVDYVVDICGCREYRYPTESSENECSPEQMFNCSIPQEKSYSKSNTTCTCNLPCVAGVYEGRLSVSYWPGLPTSLELMQIDGTNKYENITSQRENLLRMKIYYEELSYTKVEQFPSYDLKSFGSDVGGTLGLFCGMSLITILEFSDFFCVLFFKHFFKNRTR